MRLTIAMLGLELDVTFGLAGTNETAFEEYQDAGTVASTAVAVGDVPWGEVEGLHVYEPGEDRRLGFR